MIRKVLLSCIICVLAVSCVPVEGLSIFKFNNQYGYVNEKLEVAVLPIYFRVEPFNKNGCAIVGRKTGQYSNAYEIIDTSGKTVFSDLGIRFGSNIYENWYVLYSGVNSETKLMNIVTKGYASEKYYYSVEDKTDTDLIPVMVSVKEREMGYVTTKGDVVFSNKDYWTMYGFQNGKAIVGNREYHYAIINELGEYITDYIIRGLSNKYFSEDLLAVKLADSESGRTGYMNCDGEMAFYVPITYSYPGGKGDDPVLDATPFSGGYALIKTSKEPNIWRVINNKGEFVSEELPILSCSQFYDGYSCVWRYNNNGKLSWGFIDTSGQQLTGFIFDSAESFINGFAQIVYQGRDGLLDTKGNVYWSDEIMQGKINPVRLTK